MKQTLLNWYQTKHLTLSQTQRLSEITNIDTLYTLEELKLLAKMPSVKSLDKYRNPPKPSELVNANWLTDNWPLIISLLLLLLTLLIK